MRLDNRGPGNSLRQTKFFRVYEHLNTSSRQFSLAFDTNRQLFNKAMKPNFVCPVLTIFICFAALDLMSGQDDKGRSVEKKSAAGAAAKSTDPTTAKSDKIAAPKTNEVAASHGPVIDGEQFSV